MPDLVLEQYPAPGEHKLFFRGDTVKFVLSLGSPAKGKAFLRSNLGHADTRHDEIVAHVADNAPLRFQDWHDRRMSQVDDYTFALEVALNQVGHFLAKCCFFPEGSDEPVWPGADITNINVEPADLCCGNSVYCAFVRQFGPNAQRAASPAAPGLAPGQAERLDQLGYTLIPPSGTFRDLAAELDFIIHKLKCGVVHLLPVNPTPTVYGKMGRFGSPYAALDFTAVDPSLAEFDTSATPLEQFIELVDQIHARRAKVVIDIAINHTGWASKLHETHPEWFVRKEDGTFVSPGAWGVVWGDLNELNKERQGLWSYLADVFLIWCERGVDGFRCDAGYMIPFRAWEFIVAKVKREYPDTIFFLEGLGGDTAITLKLLNEANMSWAYSELFQNYSRGEVESYIRHAHAISRADGLMTHYAETHDNNRLAATSETYAKMRTALAALASSNGAFGFTNGVEWFAKEKIDVHEAKALNWGCPDNQVDHISRLNSLLLACPAFHDDTTLDVIDSQHPQVVAFRRLDASRQNPVMVLINLDCDNHSTATWRKDDHPFVTQAAFDLLSGKRHLLSMGEGKFALVLAPGQAVCLCDRADSLKAVDELERAPAKNNVRVGFQQAKAMALDLLCWRNRSNILANEDVDAAGRSLLENPELFFSTLFDPDVPLPFVRWNWPEDLNRQVLLPPGHALLILSPLRFQATIVDDGRILVRRDSLRDVEGRHFCFLPGLPASARHKPLTLKARVYMGGESSRRASQLLLLASKSDSLPMTLANQDLRGAPRTMLLTNGRGGMCRPNLRWGELQSRYDCLLAANLNPDHPEDRHVLWTRCRAWLLLQARSEEVAIDCTSNFLLNAGGGGTWNFDIPVGNGLFVPLAFSLSPVEGRNAVVLRAWRKEGSKSSILSDNVPVKLILRPDVESRGFHELTKAYTGPEASFPGAVNPARNGFSFKPGPAELQINSSKGRFHHEPEWRYNNHLPQDSGRGLEASFDLFSPGYFEIDLAGGEMVEIVGQALAAQEGAKLAFATKVDLKPALRAASDNVGKILERALRQFVVRRGALKTVVAGYPWFLDWGRDTLICVRGLVAAGMLADTRKILAQFAEFAQDGTLPNMIQGANASNRDTTDAPLWLFTACADYLAASGDTAFLEAPLSGGRTILSALESIAAGYLKGTPNGIKVDPESLLVYSPPHFTWMDTNFPAGTPREGYPVEIQALWHAALRFLAANSDSRNWMALASQVKASIRRHFVRVDQEHLSDCLHCEGFVPAAAAIPDDHLRPNQLFAITLGALDEKGLVLAVLESAASLLVPGAIRTLADRPVKYPLPINGPSGLLNDPVRPYWGQYEGDEDTRRKPAYHNGTAWTWPFPSYCEAYYMAYGEPGVKTARAILSSALLPLREGCFGQLPEIVDGNYPHAQRGCDAQAWGVTELYRVWKLLNR